MNKLDKIEDLLRSGTIYNSGVFYDEILKYLRTKGNKSYFNGLEAHLLTNSNLKLKYIGEDQSYDPVAQDDSNRLLFTSDDDLLFDIISTQDGSDHSAIPNFIISDGTDIYLQLNFKLSTNQKIQIRFMQASYKNITYIDENKNSNVMHSIGEYYFSNSNINEKLLKSNLIFNLNNLTITYTCSPYVDDDINLNFGNLNETNNTNQNPIYIVKTLIDQNKFKFSGSKLCIELVFQDIDTVPYFNKVTNRLTKELESITPNFKTVLDSYYNNDNNWNTNNGKVIIHLKPQNRKNTASLTMNLCDFLYGCDINTIQKHHPDIDRNILMKLAKLLLQ